MFESNHNKTASPERDHRRLSESKKGIFTSKYDERPNIIPYLESSLPFKQSINHSNLSQPYHINHHMGNRNSLRVQKANLTPPPQVHFRYVQNNSPIKYVPIQNERNVHHQTHTLSGQQQSAVHHYPNENVEIRKTFIPQHIHNHITLQNQGQGRPQSHQNTTTHSDEAYNLLIKQYQKLFSKFELECEHTKQLEAIINKLKLQISNQSIPAGSHPNYSLNVQLLHDILYKIYEKYVDHILRARKQSCRSRISQVFSSASHEVSSITIEETFHKQYKQTGGSVYSRQ